MNTRQPPKVRNEVLGVDASLNGTALWFYNQGRGTKLNPEGAIGLARLMRLRELLINRLLEVREDITTVVIEGYSFGSTSRAHAIGEWGGLLRVTLVDTLPNLNTIIVVPPQTLKKYVIGHAKAGECGKDIMMLKTYQKWGMEITDNDICDAHALAQAGAAITRGTGSKTENETLKKASVADAKRM